MLLRGGALFVLLYRVYRRLPAGQRRRIRGAAARQGITIARHHGPRFAATLLRTRRPKS